MKWAVFILCLGVVLADECCSPEDQKETARIWRQIWTAEFSGRRVQVAQAVFADLFEYNPEAVGLFGGVNGDNPSSPEFKAHCVRVVNGLDTCINLLDDPGVLRQQLTHLNGQHKARDGVTAAYFDAFSESFQRVMPQVSSCFNADSFRRCFDFIAGAIATDLP